MCTAKSILHAGEIIEVHCCISTVLASPLILWLACSKKLCGVLEVMFRKQDCPPSTNAPATLWFSLRFGCRKLEISMFSGSPLQTMKAEKPSLFSHWWASLMSSKCFFSSVIFLYWSCEPSVQAAQKLCIQLVPYTIFPLQYAMSWKQSSN